ncbi:hypothetical protein PG991_006304 [Apiospora marii]|uniref:Rhodopsin domain-containing protein n=1 Tax=Apiospora marii TaxID=335849 RepID=A0ABR1SD76_9PEZI
MASLSFVPSIPSSPQAFLPPANPAAAGASRAPLVKGVAIFCMLVLTTITSLRLYTRRCLVRVVGLDDYLAVVAWLSVIIVGTLYMVHTNYGLGHHIWEPMSPARLMTSLELVFVEGVMYNISLMAIKIALFAQYYRLIAQTEYRVPCLVLAALVVAWCLGMVFIVVFGCYPVQAAWDFTITEKDCTTASHGIVIGIGNIITDFILIMLPVPIVWTLKMKTSQKLAILGIFGIGSFTCVVSILRLTFLRITDDFGYSAAIIDCWTIGELSAACSCPSLMVLQPFIKKLGINLSSFRNHSRKLSDAPGRSRPSSRKIVFGSSGRRSAPQPENANGSEVELYQLYHKV